MLHHASLPVRNLARSARFYDQALGALGYTCVVSSRSYRGYGIETGKDKLLIVEKRDAQSASPGFHLAFEAPSRRAVDDFHAAAIQNGGIDNGAPGLRPDYGTFYYAAFVIDLDGHRIEAVINNEV